MPPFWIINLVLFQLTWLCAAFFTQYASMLVPLLLIVHFSLSPTREKDMKLLLLVPIGLLADKLQLEFGVFSAGEAFFPIWLLLIWVMFILSLNHSLSWLDRRSVLTLMLIGALGGSSSYWGGIKTGALEPLLSSSQVVLCLMMVWSLLLPLLVRLKLRLFHPINMSVTR